MQTGLKLEGLAGLKKALDDLPKATSKNVQRRVLLKRAQIVVDSAKAKAPVRLGHLRRSIIATTKRPAGRASASRRAFAAAGGGAAGRAASKAAGASMVEVFVGPGRHPQAGQQEFGNRNHPPHPYLRPAWDESQRRVLDGIADDMWAEIAKAGARLAKKAARAKR
jgi:HK97 gp10 family phage protein